MKLIQRIIYTGFAAVAIASAAMPVFPAYPSHDRVVMQGPDFEWYARAGREAPAVVVSEPAPRPGYIWAPQRWEWNGREHVWKEGRWIRDDYAEQVALYNTDAPATQFAQAEPARALIIERR